SYHFTDKKGKAIRNLIHASGNPEEAKVEVALWFKETDLHTYGTVHDGHVL
ncbi:nucleoside-diphosphate kinase, partial [Candidatus Woesearchaeota archaeon CG08_land_8_20_14_0_20_43_7]